MENQDKQFKEMAYYRTGFTLLGPNSIGYMENKNENKEDLNENEVTAIVCITTHRNRVLAY